MATSDNDVIALVDCCMDDSMRIGEIIKEIRADDSSHNLLSASDTVVWALKQSKHSKAKATLQYVKENFSRYKDIDIP